uniref:Ionotropic glutamate receptor C-terminal domain-containing protein n=1 Tax=Oryza punctata TaxID=4537 RepID=A0A0E0L8U0_ORYPU
MEARGLFGSSRAAASAATCCGSLRATVLLTVSVFFLLPLLAAGDNTTAAGPTAAAAAVDVGVILDLATGLGKKSVLSMEMALEDVYAAHPEFATRVRLRVRDSQCDVVAAASAAIDLISKENVAVVVGPQSTLQAEFVTYLANKTKVPVITFSATGDAVTRYHVPYFIRACAKDSFQVASIAAFVKAYEWRNVVLVFEDNIYGVGILPSITDALQDVGVNVINRSAIPAYSPNNRIDVELYKLMTMQTRVFIVHMLPARASRLFARAKALGMMTKGYVWIVTDSTGIVLDVLPQHSIEIMEGIVGFRPYIADSTRIIDFSSRFTTLFRIKYHPNADTRVAKPTIFQLWAYDVAWAVATAIEKVHRTRSLNPSFHTRGNIGKNLVDDLPALPAGPELLNSILQGEFDGLAGKFRVIDRHLQVPTYEIINVIGEKTRVIGFWSPDSGLTMSMNSRTIHGDSKFSTSSSDLKNIIWPGDSTTVPKGWDFPVNAKILRIGVPVRHDFKTFVNVETNPYTNRSTVSGYSIDVFEAAVKKLPYALRYEYIPYDCAGSYDQLVSQNFDAAVGDVTIIADRTRYADFTMPYTVAGVSMLVLATSDDKPTMWIFLKPLTMDLWIAIMVCIFFIGVVVWMIESPTNGEFQGSRLRQCSAAFYFAFSTMTFSHGQVKSLLSKIVVSYTASLSSMLTAERLQPSVTDPRQLLLNGDFVGYQNGSFVHSMLKQLQFDDRKIKVYSKQEEYANALRMGSKHGGVSAIFDEIPYLNSFRSQFGKEFQIVGPIDRTGGFGFVLPKGSPLVPDLSKAILSLTEGPEGLRIEKKWFRDPTLSLDYGNHDADSRLSSRSFIGLFIITGCVLIAMVLTNYAVCTAAAAHILIVVWSLAVTAAAAAAARAEVSMAPEAVPPPRRRRCTPMGETTGGGGGGGQPPQGHGPRYPFKFEERINAGVRRNLGALPRGYEKELKIAVPWKPGFKAFLNVTDQSVGGYCIDVFEAAVKKLPHHLSYKFSVFNGHIIKSPLSKIVVVIWCFVVLVLVQSYTASLSSILTAKKLRPSETDLEQILFDGHYVGYQQGSFVESFLIKQGFSKRRLRPYTKKQEYAEALRKGSMNGGVSAIVDEIPYLTSFLSDRRYEKEFQMISRIYKTPGFGFVFPPGFPLVHNLSTAILDVTGGDEGSLIEAKWFGTAAAPPSYAIPNTDSTPLTLQSFSGLFIITGCISALMLMISISKSVLAKCTKIRDSDVPSPNADGGNGAHEESNSAQNVMDDGYVDDRPHHEIRIDSSRDIHGSVERADGEEPGPIQNGSEGRGLDRSGQTERINAGVRRNLGGLPEVYQKKLKIAVPLKHGFRAFVNVSDQGVTGYCIDLFEAAVNKLPYRLIYEFVVFDHSYDELVQSVSSGINDAAVGDITITADRASHVEFTMPYTESGVSMLVLAENKSESTIEWVFLKPLTKELWFATMIFFLFTALVIWMIERPRNMEYQGSSTRQFSTALYFSFSTLTFSHGQIIKSPLSKIVVSYGASLASILTVKRFQPSVTDLDQLLSNGDYVGYQEGSFVHSFLTRRGFSERRLRSYTKKQEYAEALRKGSKNGGVSAIVDEIPFLTAIVSDPHYEKEFQMLKRIYKTPGFGFVFPPGFPLVHNLSTAMLDVTSGDEGSRMEEKWFGAEAVSTSNATPNTDSTPLTLQSFSGLFIIYGFMSALMLMISISMSVLAQYTEIRVSDVQSPGVGDGNGAHEESNQAQNSMGYGFVADIPLHEIRIDSCQDVHGSVERANGEEPRPIQNGPVPANSTQIRRRLLAVAAASAAFLSLLALRNAAASPATVRVGVVCDLTSGEGRRSLAGISMAVEDFHRRHRPGSAAVVELRVRDSRGDDDAAAARAAEDLIKNAQVQAIVVTTEADSVVARLIRRLHHRVPILTFPISGVASPASSSRLPHHAAAPSPFADHTSAKAALTGILTAIFSARRADAADGSPPHGHRVLRRYNAGAPRTTGCRLDRRRLAGRRPSSSSSSSSGEVLRIAVPRKTGFQAFVDVKIDPDTKRQNITGYCIDVFNAAMSRLRPRRKYEFHIFDGSYDDLVRNVSSGKFSAAVGDVTITADRENLVEFTMPYTPSGVSMLVLEENDSKPIQWIFVKPLTRDLWLATIGFFFYTGFVVWMIEQPRNPEYQGSSVRQLSTASYFAFSTLTFSHGQIIKSPLSKIVVVIWCFVVLILVQSYTASLSSMLTAKRLRPSVKSLDQLLLTGDYVGYQNGSFVGSLLRKRGFLPSRLRSYGAQKEYAEALRKGSMNGGVSAIVDEIPYLTSFLSNPQYHKEFQMVNRFYKTPGFGFVFPLGSPLVHDLSTAILNLTGETEGSRIEEKWFGSGEQSTGGDANPSSSNSSDSNPLTLQSFSGLFIISGCISALMLLVSVANRILCAACAKEARIHDVEHGGSTSSSATEQSRPLQIVIDSNLAPDQAVQEVGNYGFQDAQPMQGNVADERPNPVQNCMHHGPVPEHHAQMEMNTG